jgi:hypothetical protein
LPVLVTQRHSRSMMLIVSASSWLIRTKVNSSVNMPMMFIVCLKASGSDRDVQNAAISIGNLAVLMPLDQFFLLRCFW